MRIAVCIKQVPDAKNVKLDEKTYTLKREGVESIINPFDMYALEEGLRIKEKMGGTVTVISMGPPQTESSLREAVSYGADEAVLLSSRAFAGADTLATSKTLAHGIKKIGFDLIICGKQAIDGDTAQVGPELAAHLGLPHVSFVRKVREITEQNLTVERLMDDGYDVVRLLLPALITVVKEINLPRMPSLKGKMRAKKIEVSAWGPAEIGLDDAQAGLAGSPTKVVKVFAPQPRGKRELVVGDPAVQAASLLDRLTDDGILKISR
ncbi:MAG: electron transfer flavoprotein subunit beta/FixA family protein [Deltaproteobacteria bacterium]|nr:electron transfer flavoprotein subunit beta/FixA family protein [Deltaproteobacteria bacterium]MBF0524918.1 electron transfer flavoprotein subunit beta/FixA family protein [Deltaproteobacteria bacterium]